MKLDKGSGLQVAVLGSSSLLGRELISLLRERKFPMANLLEMGIEKDDLEVAENKTQAGHVKLPSSESLSNQDLIFVAGDDDSEAQVPQKAAPAVINLAGGEAGRGKAFLSIPSLDQDSSAAKAGRHFVAPHAATIMLSTLLLRLARRFEIEKVVATMFSPASESGQLAIEELHKQTANVLSFQKAPKEIFGEQLAFNLLPRFSGKAKAGAEKLDARIRSELYEYLAGRVPLPALRLVQSPAFYSTAISLYVETSTAVSIGPVEEALAKKPVAMCSSDGDAASQIKAAGSSEILVDSLYLDVANPEGIWIWAVADNLRLAAENAIQIAEKIRGAEKS